MNNILELSIEEMAEITGGAPTQGSSLMYDVCYCISYGLGWGSDMLAAFMMGASEGGMVYAKTGIR